MKRLVMVVLAVLMIASCARRAQPIYNVDKAFPPSAQSLSSAQIEGAIIDAGTIYQWQVRRDGEGHLVAVQSQPKLAATIDIYFDRQGYRIVKQSTTGLRDTGTTIHDHYNFWIRNLEKAIDTKVAALPPAS
jgi:uncharacterized lipoprotein YajG